MFVEQDDDEPAEDETAQDEEPAEDTILEMSPWMSDGEAGTKFHCAKRDDSSEDEDTSSDSSEEEDTMASCTDTAEARSWPLCSLRTLHRAHHAFATAATSLRHL